MNDNQKQWMDAADSPFGLLCKARMDENGLEYHNWNHVLRCLEHAAFTFQFPFDQALADCILGHDVVYGTGTDNEEQSALWVLMHRKADKHSANITKMILQTVEHNPAKDNRMILVDLANFMDREESEATRELVIQENMRMRGLSRKIVAAGNAHFLIDLHDRLEAVDEVDALDALYFEKIRHGLQLLILSSL